MVEYVRVRDPKTGHHVSIPRERAEQFKLTTLKEPAVNYAGHPLPPTYNVSVDEAAAKKEANNR